MTTQGMERWEEPRVAKRVLLTNKIAVATMLVCVPYTFVYAAIGMYWLAALMPLVSSTGYLIPWLNKTGEARRFRLARIVMFANFAVSVGLYAVVLGHDAMIHLCWFSGACLPFVLCDTDERGLLITGVASQIGAYAFVELGGRALFGEPIVGPAFQAMLGASMVPTSFGMLLMIVGAFAVSTKRAEVAMYQRNHDMQLVLDNVEQAIMTVNRDGVLAQERSAVCSTWFGAGEEGQTLWAYLEPHAPEAAAYLELGWEELWADVLPFELVVEQLPSRTIVGERTLDISYRPIVRDGALQAMLVVFTDATPELERQRAEAAQREIAHVYQCVMRDRPGFVRFLEEAGAMVETVTKGTQVGPDLARTLHTLKGNCGLFGIVSVAACCHRVEQRIADAEGTFTPADAEELESAWQALLNSLDDVLEHHARDVIEVERREFEALRLAIESQQRHAVLAELIDPWDREPALHRLERAAEQARRLASRLGRGEIEVEVEDHGVRLDADMWGEFWSAFSHVVRNAVDHGLETPDEREAAGKASRGRLVLSARRDANDIVISLEDDGRGIDWDVVAERARTLRIGLASRRDLELALFADGFTTRTEVTDTSGRGVGLAATRAAIEALGGSVDVASVRGEGTRFEFRAPAVGTARPTKGRSAA